MNKCINCHKFFNTPVHKCFQCFEGSWCSYTCRQEDKEHSSWCRLIRQSNEDLLDSEEQEEEINIHRCNWILYKDNDLVAWKCLCGNETHLEPGKPWELLGGLSKEWSPYFDIALQQKVTDMNHFIYYEQCKKEKPCNCINCLCVWTPETLGINSTNY